MPELRAFTISGVKLWFYTNDHGSPHFHARRDRKWEVKVHFQSPRDNMIEVKWQRRALDLGTIGEITRRSEQHRLELLEEWEEAQGDC